MSIERTVVATGFGVVNAAGNSVGEFRAALHDGACRLGLISRFDATDFPVRVAGEASSFCAYDTVPRRIVAKTDRFTHFALACAEEAIQDARLDLDAEDRTRVGVWFGNNTGGWDLCERGFDEYYTQGADVVNPWQATAWFLSAPQGFTTIRHGIRGMSKSFSGDRISGAAAFYYGSRAVQWGNDDVVLAGGCEAPISPLALQCFSSSGELSSAVEPTSAYRPFDPAASGLVVGEGGVVIVLEEANHAAARGATPYLEMLGGAHGTAPDGQSAEYAAVIRRALGDAGCVAEDIDMVLCEGVAAQVGDRFEATALADVFDGRPVHVTVPKSMFGHLYGASFGTDVLCGALAMADDIVPPTPGAPTGPGLGIRPSVATTTATVDRFLVTSFSRYGSCVAMVFGRASIAVREPSNYRREVRHGRTH